MEKRGRLVLIPVTAPPPLDLAAWDAQLLEAGGLAPRVRPRNPREEIGRLLGEKGVPAAAVPRRWERIGGVVVLRLTEAMRRYEDPIAAAFAGALKAQAVVEDLSGIHGRLRTPDVRLLWGTKTETVHLEGGVRYALDVAKIMFSSGNLAERIRAADLAGSGDVVVDLFAGIGYFTLPIAVRGKARAIYACELNPVSFRYLLENLRLNRVKSVVPLLGDCRRTAPQGVADLVLLGHFDAPQYLDVAFRALRGAGTVVMHELCPKERFPDDPLRHVTEAARTSWYEVTGARTRIVKSYAPGVVHAVVEARVLRRPKGDIR